ncbi:MAG TPA: HAD-IIIA family hydrolase [Candidatus Dormibacteraeota bacterium]|nr:HAD-IIIA family hydrolase [Candidatus Dormibacteraeota bacterium]
MNIRRAVFLGGNGTLVNGGAPGVRPGRLRLVRGAGEALRLLRDAGFTFVVVSNRPGVARGEYEEADLASVAAGMREALRSEGIGMLDFYYCPHDPHGLLRSYAVPCVCRKPMPGMLHRAAFEHDLDLARSWIVGDDLDDVEAGVRAGCRTVLVDGGAEIEWRLNEQRLPHHVAETLEEAARLILEDEHVLDWRERAVDVR